MCDSIAVTGDKEEAKEAAMHAKALLLSKYPVGSLASRAYPVGLVLNRVKL